MLVVLHHGDTSGSMRLGAALRDLGHRLEVVDLHRGAPLPVDLDGVDGVLTCGGSARLADRPAWLDAELDYLRQAHDRGLPLLGLCLGAQLLATALGGTVGPLDGGPEVGWHEVALTPTGREDPLFAGIGWRTAQLHWHSDHVTGLPDGARVLAASRRCPIQAWAHGVNVYAIQYHPEVEPDTVERWIEDEPDTLAEAGLVPETLLAQTEEQWPRMARLADRLFERIGMLLLPLDRRYAGQPKAIHH